VIRAQCHLARPSLVRSPRAIWSLWRAGDVSPSPCAARVCVLVGLLLFPVSMPAQSEWTGLAFVGADLFNDPAGRGPALAAEIGVRRQKPVSGLLLQFSLGGSQRRGRAELGVTSVRLVGMRGTIGYRAVIGDWAPYLSYEIGGQRVSASVSPEGGRDRTTGVIATGVTGGVTRRLGDREVGIELRFINMLGPNTTRDQGLILGAILVL